VAAAHGLSWDVALDSWRGDTLKARRIREEGNKFSVSRWAGFQVVNATPDEWEELLDHGHSGPWAERVRDVGWGATAVGECGRRFFVRSWISVSSPTGWQPVAATWIGLDGIGSG
jgi:hypothetical protein